MKLSLLAFLFFLQVLSVIINDKNNNDLLEFSAAQKKAKFSCGDYSLWEFGDVGDIGHSLVFTFYSEIADGVCQHKLSIGSKSCFRYSATYQTSHMSGSLRDIKFTQINQNWSLSHSCPYSEDILKAQSQIIRYFVSYSLPFSKKYVLMRNPTSILFSGLELVAYHVGGAEAIWFV